MKVIVIKWGKRKKRFFKNWEIWKKNIFWENVKKNNELNNINNDNNNNNDNDFDCNKNKGNIKKDIKLKEKFNFGKTLKNSYVNNYLRIKMLLLIIKIVLNIIKL